VVAEPKVLWRGYRQAAAADRDLPDGRQQVPSGCPDITAAKV